VVIHRVSFALENQKSRTCAPCFVRLAAQRMIPVRRETFYGYVASQPDKLRSNGFSAKSQRVVNGHRIECRRCKQRHYFGDPRYPAPCARRSAGPQLAAQCSFARLSASTCAVVIGPRLSAIQPAKNDGQEPARWRCCADGQMTGKSLPPS
jgi:hypothetical protein